MIKIYKKNNMDNEKLEIKPNCSCMFSCISLIATIFILFHLKEIWQLFEKGLIYLLNL